MRPTELDHTPDKVAAGPSTAATLVAEAFGTLLLVLGVLSTALFAAGFGEGTEAANKGVGFLGVALAVGITVIAGAYAFGPISGGHFNPAVTLGLAAAGRFPWRGVLPYIIAQIVGGLVATHARGAHRPVRTRRLAEHRPGRRLRQQRLRMSSRPAASASARRSSSRCSSRPCSSS